MAPTTRSLASLASSVGLFVTAVSWCSRAFAYRPFDSTDADVAEVHEIEFELGPVQYVQEEKDRFLIVPALIANAGIFRDWELVLEGRNQLALDPQPNDSRLQLIDTALSLKGVLREGSLQDRDGLSVATELGALLPTGPQHGMGASAALIVSHRLPFGSAHLNGGLALTRAHHGDAFGGLIVEGPFAWPVRPVAEVFLEREVDVASAYSGLVGAIWQVRDNLSFDAAARRGRIGGEASLTEVRAGLTWAIGL
jgi:hypothetical protein